MLDLDETLVVTAPSWGSRSSLLAVDCSRIAGEYHVNLIDSPLFQMEMANDAIQRRVLRELADWDAVKDKTALTWWLPIKMPPTPWNILINCVWR